ncbi:MAG: hypothetical protein ACE5JC_04940 [Candidatus Zixiibacteriota bacterium]
MSDEIQSGWSRLRCCREFLLRQRWTCLWQADGRCQEETPDTTVSSVSPGGHTRPLWGTPDGTNDGRCQEQTSDTTEVLVAYDR